MQTDFVRGMLNLSLSLLFVMSSRRVLDEYLGRKLLLAGYYVGIFSSFNSALLGIEYIKKMSCIFSIHS